ncbi:MAG: DMT family transporter [Bacillota bacterium]|nr:DMT family transporter [Bacillota bacterium]
MNKTPSKNFVFIGLFFTSLSSIFVKLSDSPSIILSAYRMLFASLLWVIPVFIKDREEIKKVTVSDLLWCFVSGVFLALHFASWIASLSMTSVASSTVLVSLSPVFVAAFSYLVLKEDLSLKAIIGIAVAVIGSGLIAFGDSQGGGHALKGDFLALLGAFFVGGYLLIGGRVRIRLGVRVYVLIVYSISAVVLFSIALVTKTPIYPYPVEELLLFFALAFFCSLLGHSVYNWMLEYVSSTFISVSTLGEPIFATILALIIFKEIPSILTLMGGISVLLGLYIYVKSTGVKNPELKIE